jgi:F0F1-type ATP synthase assembly protein I
MINKTDKMRSEKEDRIKLEWKKTSEQTDKHQNKIMNYSKPNFM